MNAGWRLGCVGAVVALVLAGCQPAVSPEELLRAGDTIKPAIAITSHHDGDPFAEPMTTITGTVADAAKEDGTAGQITSTSWAVEASATGGTLTLGSDGAFSIQIDATARPTELVVVLTATDWNNNSATFHLSLAVPKEITSLSFETGHNANLPFDAVGTITGTAIEVRVASGTDRSAMVATFTSTGATVTVNSVSQVSGTTPNDFAAPVVYVVTGRDTGTKSYTVTVVEVTESYGIAATPTFIPSPTTFDHDISVEVRNTTPGGVIYYTTNGTSPNTGSARYTGTIPVAGHGTSVTIRAVACAPGYGASEEANGTFTISYPPPNAPTGLGISSLYLTQIRLSWVDHSSNEAGFSIWRSPDGTTGWTEVHQTTADATSWTDMGLATSATRYYRVRAFASWGGTSDYTGTVPGHTGTSFTSVAKMDCAGDSFAMGDLTVGPNPTVSQTISSSYAIAVHEVTNIEFRAFIEDSGYTTSSYWTTNGRSANSWTQPQYWLNGSYNGDSQPVVGVSWYEAVAFCNWRSAKDGLTAAYESTGRAVLGASGYRLPTEVEWEYAAAKGAIGQAERFWPWGNTWDATKAVCSVSPASASAPANVGSKGTAGDTPQGLSDMAGNVWEWCSDNWQADGSVSGGTDRCYFSDDSPSTAFLLRGGAYGSLDKSYLRCSERYGDALNAAVRNATIGFRVCRP